MNPTFPYGRWFGDWCALTSLSRREQGEKLRYAIESALGIVAQKMALDADSVREYGISPEHERTFWNALRDFLERPS